MRLFRSLENLVSACKTVQSQWIDTYSSIILPYHKEKLIDFVDTIFLGSYIKELRTEKLLSEQKHEELSTLHDLVVELTGAVLAKEKQYRALFQHMPGLSVHYQSNDGTIIEMNKTALNVLGLDNVFPNGSSIFEFLSEESLPLVRENLQRRLRGEDIGQYEVVLKTKNGEKRSALVNATLFQDDEVLAVLTDITYFKQIQYLAKQKTDQLESFINSVPNMKVYFKDTDSKFIRVNNAKLRELGLSTMDAIIGKSDFDYYTPKIAKVSRDDELYIMNTGEPIINKEECIPADHGFRYFYVSKFPWRDAGNNIIGTLGFSVDVTEKKKIEQQLALFRHFVDKSPLMCNYSKDTLDPLTGKTAEVVQWVNETTITEMGYSLEEFVGVEVTKIPIRSLVNDPKTLMEIKRQTREGNGFHGTILNTKKDGSEIRVQLDTFKFVYGGEIYYGSIAQNITEAYNLRLALESQRAELLKANADLEQSTATKNKFFSIIAHDLRSPFQALLGLSDILANDRDSLSPDEISRMSIDLYNGIKEESALLNDLLQWSNAERGKIDFQPESIDLYTVVLKTFDQLELSAREKQNKLYIDFNPQTPIYADEHMMATVIRNLVSNANKFTENGKIIVSYDRDMQYHTVCISDNGRGMDESQRKALFNIASAVSTKDTKGQVGTGLGLLLCKEFVDRHGGFIDVESKVGEGSRFCIRIPRADYKINS